jgi:hypothetical protein
MVKNVTKTSGYGRTDSLPEEMQRRQLELNPQDGDSV